MTDGFLYSELSKKFLPNYYFIVDPGYWDSTNSEGVKLKRGNPEVRVESSLGRRSIRWPKFNQRC